MKFYLIISTVLCSFFNLNSQTYEEQIADKSCSCIARIDIKSDIDTSLKKCILQSKFLVEKENPALKPQNKIEDLREVYKKIFELINSNCTTLITKRSEHKKQKLYVESSNKEAKFYFEKGNKLAEKNSDKKAIDAYKKAIRLDENYIQPLDQLANIYFKISDFKKAEKHLKASLKLFPEGDVALNLLGETYISVEDYKDASIIYGTFLKHYPENPKAYFGLAQTEYFDKILEAALLHSIKALGYFSKTNQFDIDKANSLIDSIYTNMNKKNQLDVFYAIAKEHNFTYITKK